MIFVLSNLLFSTQLFIDEVPIRFHIRDKILKEAKAKKDYETVDELLDESHPNFNTILFFKDGKIFKKLFVTSFDIDAI